MIYIIIDLSILGADWDIYQTYIKNIRTEYKIYPDFAYNKGRIKVLQHFLDLEKIYKTAELQERFESQARRNLQQEIALLS